MALKTKKSADADLSATVRDILNAGKEDTKKVAEEVKKETEKVKMATVKAAAETKAKAEEEKKTTTAKKTTRKSTAATKATAAARATTKKASAAVRKATVAAKEAAEAKAQDPKVIIQFAGNDYDLADILKSAKKAYSKKSKKAFKDLRVYVKPEERKAYFVADDNFGSIDF